MPGDSNILTFKDSRLQIIYKPETLNTKAMKKILLISIVIATAITVNAQKVALLHNGVTTIFSTVNPFTDAYTAAVSGDTIYLPGGSFTPPNEFYKALTIFGAGHYVDSTMVTGKTYINGGFVLREDADKFYMEGLEINGSVNFAGNESINQVIIRRCRITASISISGNLTKPSTNFSLIGSVVLGNIDLPNAQIVLISNCIIQGQVSNSNSNLFNNNLWLTDYVYYGSEPAISGSNNQLNNNIFVKISSANLAVGNGNIFYRNLCVSASPGYGTLPTVNNTYTGVAQANIFINQSGYVFDYSHNYHLKTPATYLGTDGKEVGIYGGAFPYKEGAVPANPHFITKNIAAKTNINGQLQIQIQVAAQKD